MNEFCRSARGTVRSGEEYKNLINRLNRIKRQGVYNTDLEGDNYMDEFCCSARSTVRSDEEYKNLINRLNRIEGQIRGIKGMVDKSAYCPDILSQVAAATAALNAFSRVLLSSHIRNCVVNDIRGGRYETVDELLSTLRKFMK